MDLGRALDEVETQIDAVVVSRKMVADGVVELEVGRVDGGDLPDWHAGAHADFILSGNLIRQYSLIAHSSDRKLWKVAVLCEPQGRGGSAAMHQLKAGDDLKLRGPRNNFPLIESRRYIFLAGGIGITPIIPMIAEAEGRGVSWNLFYGGRSTASMAYHAELLKKYPGNVTLYSQDSSGIIPLEHILAPPVDDTLIYCCGPEALLLAVEKMKGKWPTTALHVERFSPKEIVIDGSDQTIEVELALSGITLQVPPGQSILDAVTAAGVDVMMSCGEGTCGTCETVVLDGIPDHRDSILSRSEQESGKCMMICVSRAKSRKLALEL